MNEAIWQDWVNKFKWILQTAKRRNWDYDELKIKPPIQEHSIKNIEENLGITYQETLKKF